ncbi:ABC transporter permease subunit [Paramaledivibacter caminithermalis]|jgi:simple sugar transport system permease protein|uniref:Simple sugar transport system permease protein n=1 Tax=Paramaledivibacter caminithermalis (strain DSM 15212 / CIP 107654 / DViRD3) TaxID=1121301 RepID=A0A1M6PYK1_PARC5|nr:ABC transporter permease [Paramaledivibacter caminithermalis]SHK12981.1 simple sugar transport system permease protein [Paramaledivibacter caminithermalis DSM 15212]
MDEMNNISVQEYKDKGKNLKRFFIEHSATMLFLVMCIIASYFSGYPVSSIVREIVTRLSRNAFLVLSLIIPVLAGMGLNFGIVIGAMAGQIAIVAVTHFGIYGIKGFLLCIVLSTPLAIIFGILIGRLLNKTKGQEMIASLIAGFFTMGLYQFLFLFMIGTVIPMKNKVLMLSGGVGIRNTIDLGRNDKGIKYALDNLWKMPLWKLMIIASIISTIVIITIYFWNKRKGKDVNTRKLIFNLGISFLVLLGGIIVLNGGKRFVRIQVPMVTGMVIAGLCIFNVLIVKTKLGQDFRTVGQDMHIAKVSGINVDKIRIIAVTISILLAAWGQIIFLQNIGTLSTYGSHVQIATFSIAAILIGGASVSRATIGQALLGVVLFHTLFYVSPKAGNNLFGAAQIGEYFRAFVAYGVIGISLGLHAWRKAVGKK